MCWNRQTARLVCAWFIGLLLWCAPPVRAEVAEDRYAVAAQHYGAARWELAIEEFTAFLTWYPDHPRSGAVTFFLAESLMQAGRWDDARQRFEQYLERSPGGKYVRQAEFRLGEISHLAGEHLRAREELERFRQAYPGDELCAYALPYLGEVALALQDAAAARDLFAEALGQFPDGPLHGECRFGMARALQSLGDLDGAARFYQFVSAQGAASPLADDATLQLAMLRYHQGQFAESQETLSALVERFPGSDLLPQARYWLGQSQAALGDYAAAGSTLDDALRRHASHELAPAMAFAAADAYRRAGERVKAEALCERLLQQWPATEWADDSLQILIQMAFEAHDFPRVLALADRFAREYPQSPLASAVLQTLARAHLKAERFDAAVRVLEPLVDAGSSAATPSDSAPWLRGSSDEVAVRYYLALGYLGVGRHQAALELLDRLTVIREPAEFVQGVRVARAAALVALGRLADAVTPLQEYLAAVSSAPDAPDDPDVERCRAQLAVVLTRLGQWEDVESVLAQWRQSHADAQQYGSTILYVAEAAYSAQRNELAATLFQELADHGHSPESTARGLSGLAWLRWRDKDGATQSAAVFQELLERCPESPLAAEAALMRGQALEKTGSPTDALAMYRLVIDRYGESPHVSAALLSAARICDALQQDAEAERILRAWLDRYPSGDQRDAALYQLAWVLFDQGRDGESDAVFRQLHQDFRGSRYWSDATYRLAERAARAGDGARAEALATEIVDAEPHGAMTGYALFLCGQLAAAAQRWDDVDRAMRRLVAEYPDSDLKVPAEYWLAESRYRNKDYAQAGRLFERLERATQGRTDSWMAMIPLRRAQVQAHAGRWDDAYDLARPIAQRYPAFAQQHEVDYLLGRYFTNRAEFDQARQAYQRVIASPTGANTETAAMAQWMIGETYFMQQQYRQAIKAYHRVHALYPYDQWQAVALLQAGKCHEAMGQWDEAVKLYAQIGRDFAATRVADKAASRLRVARQKADPLRTR